MEAEKDINPDRKSRINVFKKCWNVFKKCWKRTLERVSWMCYPEGPSPYEIICKLMLRWFGVGFIIVGLIGWFISFPSMTSLESISLPLERFLGGDINLFRYITSAFVFFGSGFYFVAKHSNRVDLKTAVFNEEIDSLISEVKRCAKGSVLAAEVKHEVEKLEYFKEKPSEVSQRRLISLRKLHVELITEFEKLKAHAESDISDYKHYTGEDHLTYLDYRNSFNELYRMWDLNVNRKSTESEFSVRLKELREDLSIEKYWSGQGEAILESITHWSMPAIISLVVMGVTPLLMEPIFLSQLSLINWGLLGMAGAILFTTVKMRNLDFSRVGEEEGNYELRRMLLGMVIGMISAVLLYVSIRSGLLGGKALPRFAEILNDKDIMDDNDIIISNSLSVFWAIAAGYSAKLVDGMLGAAEKVTNS